MRKPEVHTSFCVIMSHSGHKRSRDEDSGDPRRSKRDGLPYEGSGVEQETKKPRDWREAFLNDSDRKPHRYAPPRLWRTRLALLMITFCRDRRSDDDRDNRYRERGTHGERRHDRDYRHKSERDRSERDGRHGHRHRSSRDHGQGSYDQRRDKYERGTEAHSAREKEDGE